MTYGAGSGVQGDNPERGTEGVDSRRNRLIYTYELDGALGGPIKRDRLWFFGGTRATRQQELRRRRV